MSRLVILTGATGGIGSELLLRLECCRRYEICCLSRKKISGRYCVLADFSAWRDSLLEPLEEWIASRRNPEEIILILAASSIKPIDGIGSLGADIFQNISTNVVSQVNIVNAVVRCAQTRDLSIRIVQFDSGAAYRPIGGWSLYCSSKAYMSMFLQTLAVEHRDYKIVLFDPGVVDTNMQKYIRETESDSFIIRDTFKGYKEKGQLHAPADIARFVAERYVDAWKAESLKEKYTSFL